MYSGPHNPEGPWSKYRPIKTATKNGHDSPILHVSLIYLRPFTIEKEKRK
jgi:hypothetical protein